MDYHVYFLDGDRHMYRAGRFHCATDAEARGRLGELSCPGMATELWEGGRLVACVRQPGCAHCEYAARLSASPGRGRSWVPATPGRGR
jgi:hypothetical protein